MIQPEPIVAGPRLPWVGAGPAFIRDPTGFLTRARHRHGDSFLVSAFGYQIFCVFSAAGVRNLWALPERQASKGAADFALLRHKVPAELFDGRRTMPHGLFARDDVAVYLDHLRVAVDTELNELGTTGSFEAFRFTRRLAHRMGLASWGGRAAASPRYLDRLVAALDRLDASESFVHPHRAFWTVATGKRAERAALAEIENVFAEILASPPDAPDGGPAPDLFQSICDSWKDEPSPEREVGIARDVALVHMGSQSNLYAAMAWTLIHLLERPELLEAVRAGDDALLDRCASEAIRLNQRSIVLRQVLAPIELADENTTWNISPGAFVATMMSVTNTSAAPDLDRFDPDHYDDRRFTRAGEIPTPELVTTFGHGRHSCPAQRFSIEAIRHSIGTLVRRYGLEMTAPPPVVLRRQLGGIARASHPCAIRYLATPESDAPRRASS